MGSLYGSRQLLRLPVMLSEKAIMSENLNNDFSLVPTGQGTGMKVCGISLRDPLPDNLVTRLKTELAVQGVLIFSGQKDLTEEEQLRFTRAFGETFGHPLPGIGGKNPVKDTNQQVFYLTNAVDGGDTKAGSWQQKPNAESHSYKREGNTSISRSDGELAWHSDLQYMPEPQVYSVLYGMKIPRQGGETEWCNMTLAYATLDDATKRQIEGLQSINWLTRKIAPVTHPVVRVHPLTGERALYVSPGLSRYIAGWDEEKGRQLIRKLTDHATRPEFCYSHSWTPGDVIMWDNRVTMHRRKGFDLSERRVMRRTQTIGEVVIAA
ncbi:MAG: TauD/TfdA family dioxygenase [Rhodospirillales bacterium]